jgi:DNA-binding transcriptional ArsR family regulator/uncharacterized protein YndB with AHSA1/START domain
VTDLDATLGALRSRTRREILGMVWDRQMAAGDIAAAFSVSAATISEHLSVLRRAGLVEMTKAGTSRLYRARPDGLSGLHQALAADSTWRLADDVPERRLVSTSTGQVVVASVDLPVSVDDAFEAFVNAENFSSWIGAPVHLEDGQFAATLEWGTEVRGCYEIVVPPRLIVMSWDFDDDNVPVPGRPLTTYLRVIPHRGGSRVVVHQLVDEAAHAGFLEGAWAGVLGRLKASRLRAAAGEATTAAKPRRAKSTGAVSAPET